MYIDDVTPDLLNQNRFRLEILRLPNVIYHCQSANLPGLSVGTVEQTSPFGPPIMVPGTSASFEELQVSFMVDEDLRNWREIQNWLRKLTSMDEWSDTDIRQWYSDATLFMLTNKSNPNLEVAFRGIFPTSVGSLEFSTTGTDSEPQITTATFAYTSYEFVTRPDAPAADSSAPSMPQY